MLRAVHSNDDLAPRPSVSKDTHAGGHLWNDLIGWTGDPHLSPFHLASYVAIGAGFWLLSAAWRVLHQAAQQHHLAPTGPYARVRHPQYDGFLLIMIGFLLQWPTIPALVMFPILVYVYIRLARSEEREVAAEFGDAWSAYAARTPAFWPRMRHGRPHPPDATPRARHTADSAPARTSEALMPGIAQAAIVLGVLAGLTILLTVLARAERHCDGPRPK